MQEIQTKPTMSPNADGFLQEVKARVIIDEDLISRWRLNSQDNPWRDIYADDVLKDLGVKLNGDPKDPQGIWGFADLAGRLVRSGFEPLPLSIWENPDYRAVMQRIVQAPVDVQLRRLHRRGWLNPLKQFTLRKVV